jgi:hypothetical protein
MTHAFHTDDCPQSSPDYDLTDPAVVLALVGRVRLLEAVAKAARELREALGRDGIEWDLSAAGMEWLTLCYAIEALAALDVDPPPTEVSDE